MLTVTVDRNGVHTGKRWESPEAAFDHVTRERVIVRLLRHLGFTSADAWLYALEWQMATSDERGSGWPHWHIVLPRPVDLNVAAAWLRVEQICGSPKVGVDLQGPEDLSKDQIANYLGSYLTKGGDVGDWVSPRYRVRTVSASRRAGLPTFASYRDRGAPGRGLGDDDDCTCEAEGERVQLVGYVALAGGEPASSRALRAAGPRVWRTIGEAVSQCGRQSVLIAESDMTSMAKGGEIVAQWKERRYLGHVACDLRAVRRLAERRGEVVERELEMRVVEWVPDELLGIDRETWAIEEDGAIVDVEVRDVDVHSFVPGSSVVIGERALYVSRALVDALPFVQKTRVLDPAAREDHPSLARRVRRTLATDDPPEAMGRAPADGLGISERFLLQEPSWVRMLRN